MVVSYDNRISLEDHIWFTMAADQMNGFAAFLVGEPIDHDAGNDEPRYEGYRRDGGKWFVSSRPITRKEFQAEMQH